MKFHEVLHQIIELKWSRKKIELKWSRKKLGDSLETTWKTFAEEVLKGIPNDAKEQAQALLKEIGENFGFSMSGKPKTKRSSDEKTEIEQEALSQGSEAVVRIHHGKGAPADVPVAPADIYPAEVEKLLLPIMQLAHLYEKNGDAKEHAKKLGEIFTNINDALHYLDRFAITAIDQEKQRARNKKRTVQDIPVVHDACLFALPEEEEEGSNKGFSFKTPKWQKLVKEHMQDPEFRNLLSQAPEIEAFIIAQRKRPEIKSKKPSKDDLKAAKEKIKSIIREYTKIRQLRIDNKASVTAEQETTYKDYGKNLLEAQCQLVDVSAALGCTLDAQHSLSIEELKAYFNKFRAEAGPEFQEFLNAGLTKEKYAMFLTLKRVDDDANVHPIVIDGRFVGYPGYYLRRLNVQQDADASLAARLGKLSDCCQSLSGEVGQPCAIHGLTSRYGGFYVVCEGDVASPSAKDKLVCQSWVWRSQSEAIVIDSVEAKNRLDERNRAIAQAFYRELAYQLVTVHGVPRVCCGFTSGISRCLNPETGIQSNEVPKDYSGYRDAVSQFIIYTRDTLYLLPGKEAEFFKQCSDKNLTAKHPMFIRMLDFTIRSSSDASLRKHKGELLATYQKIFGSEGEEIVNRCREFYSKFSCGKSCHTAISIMLCETPYLFDIRDNRGRDLLDYLAFNDSELLKKLVLLYPEKHQLLETIKEKDADGRNILHKITGNPKSLELILELYPEEDRLKAVKERDILGKTVLDGAARNLESFKQILNLLPESIRPEVAKEKDADGRNVLHRAVCNSELFREILNLLPESSRLEIVKEKDKFCADNVLHRAACNPESFSEILNLLPESSRLEIVKEKNERGETVLHKTAKYPELLKQVLELYSAEERLSAVKQKNDLGYTVLHEAAQNLESFKQILNLLPESIRQEAVAVKGITMHAGTILHKFVKNPESLKQILELLPAESRLQAVKEKNSYGNSLLHIAAQYPESLREILNLLPESSRLEAVKEKDSGGDTVLCLTAEYPKSLKQILEFLPGPCRLGAVQEKNKYGETVLFAFSRNPESFKQILELYPEEDRLKAVKEKDGSGRTALGAAAYDLESFKQILNLLPESSRLEVVKEKDRGRDTVLHRTACKSEVLREILTLLPEPTRLEAVKERSSCGETVLHSAAQYPESLQKILELYPVEERLKAVKEKNDFGHTVLHEAAQNLKSLEKILSLLPAHISSFVRKKAQENGQSIVEILETFREEEIEKAEQNLPCGIEQLSEMPVVREDNPQNRRQDTSVVVMHVNQGKLEQQPDVKQRGEETKIHSDYQYRTGIDTYSHRGEKEGSLGFNDKLRERFNALHASTLALLKEEPLNPLLEEGAGFVYSAANMETRPRVGECFITHKALQLWLDKVFNPKIKKMGLSHQVYAGDESEIRDLLKTAAKDTSLKPFTVIIFLGIHAVSIFVDQKNKVSFILDPEPKPDPKLEWACKSVFPGMRVLMPEENLCLQKDYYSCVTFCLKSARYYAKYAESFSQLLVGNEGDIVATTKMPAALLKMAQTELALTQAQYDAIVSKKEGLTLRQYKATFTLIIDGKTFNTAAFKVRNKVIEDISRTISDESSEAGGAECGPGNRRYF